MYDIYLDRTAELENSNRYLAAYFCNIAGGVEMNRDVFMAVFHKEEGLYATEHLELVTVRDN